MGETFEEQLRQLINRESLENKSDTPDWVLAAYLVACLDAFNKGVNSRDRYYGRKIGNMDQMPDRAKEEAWEEGAQAAWERSTSEVNGARYYWRHDGEPANPYRERTPEHEAYVDHMLNCPCGCGGQYIPPIRKEN